ncbi:MAG: hypothetical protein ACFE7R_03815 [Candidatus Hodarchaeota archaeon]
MKKARPGSRDVANELETSEGSPLTIPTPYDDLIPVADEPSAQFYIDAMRIYLGLYEGTISVEEALHAVEILKENPEYAITPTNPTRVPLNEEFKNKILSNLQTLRKFNLITVDSVKSAYSFAFLTQDNLPQKNDLDLLRLLEVEPNLPLVNAAKEMGLTPRTIARSIERLQTRNVLRFAALYDTTAFGVQSYILFFTLADGVEWSDVERGFAEYPFTKSILKTTMTDLGYASFMIPGPKSNFEVFEEHARDVSNILFDYSCLHTQIGSGADTNLSLFDGTNWRFPDELVKCINEEADWSGEKAIRVLLCQGYQKGLSEDDFLILNNYRLDIRAPPREISANLRMRGWNFDARQVAQTIRKMNDKKAVLPFLIFDSVGLSTNFCFEVVCTKPWRESILQSCPYLPSSTYFLSSQGIIIWAQVPSNQQVEYYQLFRTLEDCSGIQSVHPIMTIKQHGSRSELDLTKFWRYGSEGWMADSSMLDLTTYMI